MDTTHWELAFAAAQEANILNLPPAAVPQSPGEALCLALAGWDSLRRYHAGDHLALERELSGTLQRYAALRAGLTAGLTGSDLTTRARMAAILDFLRDPPEDLPPYCPPLVAAIPPAMRKSLVRR